LLEDTISPDILSIHDIAAIPVVYFSKFITGVKLSVEYSTI
jgi:hypothetical protein